MSVSDAKWEALRPWTPRLALSVREVTSVSATFLLSSLSPNTNLSLILDAQDDQDESSGSSSHILSDSVTKGLSVKANGQAWPRVLARLDDDKDEAVVIVYGLLPGIQYDIEFAIVPGDLRMKSHIQTETSKRKCSSHHVYASSCACRLCRIRMLILSRSSLWFGLVRAEPRTRLA